MLVDGDAGTALLRPGQEAQEEYRARRAALPGGRCLEPSPPPPRWMGMGGGSTCHATRGHPAEAVRAAAEGGGGDRPAVRTEFLPDRPEPPTEEEQLAAHLAAARPFPAAEWWSGPWMWAGTSRSHGWPCPRSEPLPGLPGASGLFARPELFRVQLRALLRAGAEVPGLRVLLPMVTAVSEVRRVRTMLAQCAGELEGREWPVGRSSLGVMIETLPPPERRICWPGE